MNSIGRESTASNLLEGRYIWLGYCVAAAFLFATLPDLIQTFLGNRDANNISFTPAWIKAIRDIVIFSVFLFSAHSSTRRRVYLRMVAVPVTIGFALIALSRGYPLDIALRGVLWLPVLLWTMSSSRRGAHRLLAVLLGIARVLVPASLVAAIGLGFFGKGMYYESVAGYQRNPGLFLAPSATAFAACSFYLMLPKNFLVARRFSIFFGFLSISGVFFINALLFFGRLPRQIYAVIIVFILIPFLFLNVDQVLHTAAALDLGLRSGEAVSSTLGARLLIINQALTNLSALGNYPVGLNVAANQGGDLFFPDNAYLAAVYAFGIIGFFGLLVCYFQLLSVKNRGVIILLLTSSIFYVWFENLLFAAFCGMMANPFFWNVRADHERKL